MWNYKLCYFFLLISYHDENLNFVSKMAHWAPKSPSSKEFSQIFPTSNFRLSWWDDKRNFQYWCNSSRVIAQYCSLVLMYVWTWSFYENSCKTLSRKVSSTVNLSKLCWSVPFGRCYRHTAVRQIVWTWTSVVNFLAKIFLARSGLVDQISRLVVSECSNIECYCVFQSALVLSRVPNNALECHRVL